MIENEIKSMEDSLLNINNKIAVLESDREKYILKIKEMGIDVIESEIKSELDKLTDSIRQYRGKIDSIITSVKKKLED